MPKVTMPLIHIPTHKLEQACALHAKADRLKSRIASLQQQVDETNASIRRLIGRHLPRRQPKQRMPHALGRRTHREIVRAVLSKAGRPVKLEAIVSRALDMGAETNCRRPEWPLHAVLCRNPEFVQVGNGRWALRR